MFAKAEAAILARLKAQLPGDVHVGPLRDLEMVAQYRQKAPAVWLIYDGYEAGERIAPLNYVQKVTQQWYAVIATKSAKGSGTVTEAQDQASELCELVLAALLGFQVSPGAHLRLEDAPGPEYDAGYCHVPIAFSNFATFKGAL